MRDELLDKWFETERGTTQPTLKELIEMRNQCFDYIRQIGYGVNIKTLLARVELKDRINEKIRRQFGDWSER